MAFASYGEARMILERPGGVEDLKLGGDRLFFVSGTLPSARHANEVTAESERLDKLREDSGVSAVLYETAPTRDWDHDLGPDVPTLLFVDAVGAAAGASVQDQTRHVRLPEGRLLGYEPRRTGVLRWSPCKLGWTAGGNVRRSGVCPSPTMALGSPNLSAPSNRTPGGKQVLSARTERGPSSSRSGCGPVRKISPYRCAFTTSRRV